MSEQSIPRTSISVGRLVHAILSADTAVSTMTGGHIFPSVKEVKVSPPYVCYQRVGTSEAAVKSGQGADSCIVRCDCFGRSYNESVDLAELVRAALETDGYSKDGGGLRARSIIMTDSTDEFTDAGSGIYYEQVTFEMKIN